MNRKRDIAIQSFDKHLLNELSKINLEIESCAKKEGELEISIEIWNEQLLKIDIVSKELKELIEIMNEVSSEDKIAHFNIFFTNNTKKLYGKNYYVAYSQEDDGQFPLKLSNTSGADGPGKKKGLIAAFDLAYYMFSKSHNIKSPSFIVHDKMEVTDKEQLKTTFEIANECGIQLIIPLLQEKIDFLTVEQKKDSIVLELSDNDKFFKID